MVIGRIDGHTRLRLVVPVPPCAMAPMTPLLWALSFAEDIAGGLGVVGDAEEGDLSFGDDVASALMRRNEERTTRKGLGDEE